MAKGRFRKRRGVFRRKRRTILSKVKKIVDMKIAKNTEMKLFDSTATQQTVSDAGTLTNLTAVGQGDHDDQRQGDKLTPKKLIVKMNFVAGDSTNICRVVIFRWKQYSGSIAPTQALLMDYTTANGVLAPLSMYAHDYRSTFQILHDKTIYLNAVSKPQVGHSFRLNLKRGPKINFVATTTNAQNHIYMYIVSDSAAATHPNYSHISRFNFVDS